MSTNILFSSFLVLVSCITALERKLSKKRKNDDETQESDNEQEYEGKIVPGVALWIAFDWPQYGMAAYENHIRKIFLAENVNPLDCTAIRGRGTIFCIF